jgi:hypothetical protein
LLQWVYGQYNGVIICLDELCATYAKFALSGFDAVVLHPS